MAHESAAWTQSMRNRWQTIRKSSCEAGPARCRRAARRRASCHALHRAAEVEVRVGMARHTQRAAVRRRHLLHVDVVADAPLPRVGQRAWPCDRPGLPAPLPLLTRGRSGRRTSRSTRAAPHFQRGGGAVHRRGPGADHPTRRPFSASWSQSSAECAQRCAAGPCTKAGTRAAQAVAAGGQHQRRASTSSGRPAAVDLQRHQAIGAAAAPPVTRWPLRTSSPAPGGTSAGSPSTAGAGILSSAAQAARPNCASNQARKVSDGMPSAGR
jgi:hypothetical protein